MTLEEIINIYNEASGETLIPIKESISTIRIAPAVKAQSIKLYNGNELEYTCSKTGAQDYTKDIEEEVIYYLFKRAKWKK